MPTILRPRRELLATLCAGLKGVAHVQADTHSRARVISHVLSPRFNHTCFVLSPRVSCICCPSPRDVISTGRAWSPKRGRCSGAVAADQAIVQPQMNDRGMDESSNLAVQERHHARNRCNDHMKHDGRIHKKSESCEHASQDREACSTLSTNEINFVAQTAHQVQNDEAYTSESRMGAAPSLRLPNNGLPTARTPTSAFGLTDEAPRCRTSRSRASPASVFELPEDVHDTILDHLPVRSIARLALASKGWNRSIAASLRTKRRWQRLFEQVNRYSLSLRSWFEWHDDMAKLFSAVFTLCDGPSSCVQLVKRMTSLAIDVESGSDGRTCWSTVVVAGGGTDTFGRLLNKCPRPHEWTAELVSDAFLAMDGMRTLRVESIEEASLEVSDALAFREGLAERQGFSVGVTALLSFLVHPDVIHSSDGRSWYVMQTFAEFVDGYCFEDLDGVIMGKAVAAMHWPIEDVVNLIVKLNENESLAEFHGWTTSSGRSATVAFIRAWARDSNFPRAWAEADLCILSANVARDGELKKHTMPIILEWLEAVLRPLTGTIGVLPDLKIACDLIAAFR